MSELPDNLDNIPMEENVQNQESGNNSRRNNNNFTSFTDILGTYKVSINRLYIPIGICIVTSLILSWFAKYPAEQEINSAIYDPEESSTLGIILNGLIPVLISAILITVLYFVIKKYGMIVFKYFMGLMVIFYVWFGFTYNLTNFFIVFWNWMSNHSVEFWWYLYNILYYGSLIYLGILGYKFFKGTLSHRAKNLLVLFFGIFLGSIIGQSMPTWTMIMFATFLSLWDLITVFHGPLGKIADIVIENKKELNENLVKRIKNGEITEDQAYELGFSPSVHDYNELGIEVKEETEELSVIDHEKKRSILDGEGEVKTRDVLKDIEIELGSGDLIMYSGLVSHVFIMTLNWVVTIITLIGVLSGLVLTLYYLLTKKRILPALPFSMFFGIICFLISAGVMGLL